MVSGLKSMVYASEDDCSLCQLFNIYLSRGTQEGLNLGRDTQGTKPLTEMKKTA